MAVNAERFKKSGRSISNHRSVTFDPSNYMTSLWPYPKPSAIHSPSTCSWLDHRETGTQVIASSWQIVTPSRSGSRLVICLLSHTWCSHTHLTWTWVFWCFFRVVVLNLALIDNRLSRAMWLVYVPGNWGRLPSTCKIDPGKQMDSESDSSESEGHMVASRTFIACFITSPTIPWLRPNFLLTNFRASLNITVHYFCPSSAACCYSLE